MPANAVRRALQHRRRGCASVGENQREAVQQQIARTRRLRRLRRGPHGPGDVEQTAGAVRQPPGEQRRAPRVEIGVARQPGVERLERLRSPEQQRRRVATAVLGEGELGVQQIDASPPELVQRAGLRRREQPERHVERAGLQGDLCGREHALGTARRIDRQARPRAQERGRSGEPAARLRAPRRLLELRRDVLVGACRGLRTVPRTAIGLERRRR